MGDRRGVKGCGEKGMYTCRNRCTVCIQGSVACIMSVPWYVSTAMKIFLMNHISFSSSSYINKPFILMRTSTSSFLSVLPSFSRPCTHPGWQYCSLSLCTQRKEEGGE